MALDVIKIKDIFLEALAKPTAQERYQFVEQACENDKESLDYIKGMLDAHERYATPVPDGTTKFEPVTHSQQTAYPAGTIIDQKYKIIELIAEGGMGSVYRANRITELRMEVALKIIKPGMDSRQILNRFNLERQALALMSHENIAKVYDAGTTESGLPYFVMELVRGSPLTKFCDDHKLSVQERLELFEKICSGVQHAHQKGIVHRDLKPNNILIGMFDDKPVPKIIDFGLAKAMHQPLLEESFHTRIGTFVGTWQYTAPEQAQFNNLDVDTRADIYSLGVILYELLTGQTPIERARFKQAAYNEVLRIIREEEPPKPSTKIHSSDQLPSIAALRRVEPLKLERMVRGELDWIVMKSLEKDRTRRYASANELGADIARFLKDEPVSAGPPTMSYRLHKLVHRHRGKVLVAALMLAIIATGSIVSTVGWYRVYREKQRADLALDKYQAINEFFLKKVLSSADPIEQIKPGQDFVSNITVLQALDIAAVNVSKQFVDKPEIEAEIHFTIGKTYQGLGEFKKARLHFEKAEKRFQESRGAQDESRLSALFELGHSAILLSEFEHGERILKEVLALCTSSKGASDPMTLKVKTLLANTYSYTNRSVQAEEMLKEVLAIQKRMLSINHLDTLYTQRELASLMVDLGQTEASLTMLKEVLQYLPGLLGKENPQVLITQNNYAYALQSLKKYDEALRIMKDVVSISSKNQGEENPNTLKFKTQLASVHFYLNQIDEAIQIFVQIVPKMKMINGPVSYETLAAIQGYGACLATKHKFEEAEKLLMDAYAGCRTTLGDNNDKTILLLENLVNLFELSGEKEKMKKFREILVAVGKSDPP